MPERHEPSRHETAEPILRVAVRRLSWRYALAALAGAAAVAALVRVSGLLLGAGSAGIAIAAAVAGLATFAVLFRRSAGRRSPAAAAQAIEAAHPGCRNLLITAEELARHPERASPWIRARVFQQAGRVTAGVNPNTIIRTRQFLLPAVALLLAGVVNLVVSRPVPARAALDRIASAVSRLAEPANTAAVTVTVIAPSYVGGQPLRLENPDRIEALAGSRLVFAVGTDARIRFGDRPLTGSGLEHVVGASGYFVIESAGSRERQFVPLTAKPDNAPAVRISAPGKDLLMAAGDRTIPIAISASDDLALGSLDLRFTKVSGSGEQFEFEEGSLPIRVERSSDREWRGSGSLSLPGLNLAPGDSLIYRAVSRDRRPGDAGYASSDTYFVEILGPGQVALEGVEMPPELERFGMSQQMIVLKLERLRAQERSLARAPFVEQLASLAAEQRTVRANFIFLLGGHVEDEEEEAEQSHEIQEGRLENTARRDINVAVGHMTRAEQGMTAANTGTALSSARDAVAALQRAFGRNRYLLRSLAVRSRLDPARRLTGDTAGASDWRRILDDLPGRAGEKARALRDTVLDAGARWSAGAPATAGELEALAEALLAMEPSGTAWTQASQRLLDARGSVGSPGALQKAVEDVATLLRTEAGRGTLRRTPAHGPGAPLRRAFDAEVRR